MDILKRSYSFHGSTVDNRSVGEVLKKSPLLLLKHELVGPEERKKRKKKKKITFQRENRMHSGLGT